MPTDVRDDQSLKDELNRSVQKFDEAKKDNDEKSESYSELLTKLD